MRIGYFLSSEEFDPRELVTPAHYEQASELVSEDMVAEAVPCGPVRWGGRQSPQLSSMFEAVRRALRGSSPTAQPMMSRSGVRAEARRVRSILRASMKDQQLIGGK